MAAPKPPPVDNFVRGMDVFRFQPHTPKGRSCWGKFRPGRGALVPLPFFSFALVTQDRSQLGRWIQDGPL